MVLVLVALTAGDPAGGALSRYHRANALARRGHVVHIVHMYRDRDATSLAPGWFRFESGVEHHVGFDTLPPDLHADVALGVSRRGILPACMGRPFSLHQGRLQKDRPDDAWVTDAEGPIACVSGWLVDACIAAGVDAFRVRHIPDGIDQGTFTVLEPPFDRPPRVSFLCHRSPGKGDRESIAVLEAVRSQVPDLEAVAFGVPPRPPYLPGWIEYVERPDHQRLAAEIYNACRVVLCTSRIEGFGLTSLEAMACGSALVTLDTGGSRDFAHDGDTALVSDQGALDALAAHLVAVLRDDDLHRRLVTNALKLVPAFDWERSTDTLEALLREYLAEPDRFTA